MAATLTYKDGRTVLMIEITSSDIVEYLDRYVVPSVKGESRDDVFGFWIPLDTTDEVLEEVREHYKETFPRLVLDIEREKKDIHIKGSLQI